ncbi:MAG: hypothetical protein E7486_05470, partial [Ruminococcaceae bacterium]|nr:hypothetical protein [Oscillospiraceae bacterium]
MKKVLSLVIALAMTIGLVSAFSASATSATVLKASDAIGDPTMYVEWCASAESHMENGVKVTSADVMESTYCFVAMARADVVNTPYLVIKFDEATLASNDPNTLVRIYDGYTGGTEVINNLRIGDATTDVMCFDLREYINCGGNMPEVVSLYVMLLDIAPGSTVAFESMYFTDTIPADDNTGDDTPDFEINDDAIAVGKPWATAATVENYDSITDVSVIFPGNNSIWAWQAGTAASAVL